MPAYNYFPATYQPYYQAPYMQMPQPPQQNQQQAAPVQASSIIWVGSDYEADAYPIAPNNAVALWNRSSPVVYIKQADASGKPTIKTYDLVERTKMQQPATQDLKSDNSQVYATKDEIESVTTSIEAMKSDIKMLKKSIRKKAEDDDDDE